MNTIRKRIEKLKQLIANWDKLAKDNENTTQSSSKYFETRLKTSGKRKLYLVTVESGNEISSSFLPVLVVKDFIKKYIVGNSKQEVFNRVSKYFEDDKVKANIFNNIILNCNGIKPSNTIKLRDLFIENGIDYELVDNAFGWGEEMMVLYNLKKIKSIERITDNSQKYKDSREFIDKIISEGLKKS
jgi:hypothetical protein